jgi:hypothetical protein
MGFPINLFTIKNVVFMNNLYHKIAVASACTVLGFALGANKEAKAATLSLEPTSQFIATDHFHPRTGLDGLGNAYYFTSNPSAEMRYRLEIRAFYEFNIANLSLATDTVIRHAIVEARIDSVTDSPNLPNYSNYPNYPSFLSIFGYVGNGMPDISDYEAGVFLSSVDLSSSSTGDIISFDVTPFVNQLVSNNDAFAGFGIRATNSGGVSLGATNKNPSLIIETAEPVPEPTTIFGSAIAIGVGGWLKRKKSNQQDKTTSQH